MGTSSVNRRINQTARVAFRLSQDEKNRLVAECSAHGVTFSDLVRSRIIGVTLLSRIEAKAIAELRRQGGLLKYLVTKSDVMDAQQVRNAIATIVATVKLIGDQASDDRQKRRT